MCGIFAYTGTKEAAPILIDGLRSLEYRGYDSAGVCIPGWGVQKAVGPIDNLAAKMLGTISGMAGIAHTRWATHGAPTEVNAHPHAGGNSGVWLVHNGIIENYRDIRDGFERNGYAFRSETDSEVLAHLVGEEYEKHHNLVRAVQTALARVRGTYGVAVIAMDAPDTIVAARMGSPIVLGVSPHGRLIASDPSALLAHTKEVVYLEDGEIAVITPTSYHIETLAAENRERLPETIEWDIEAVQKNGYEHFMMKEIMEGPEVLRNTMRGRLLVPEGRAVLGGIEEVADRLSALSRLTIVGCGSAYYAGQAGAHLLERYAKLPVAVELASEYRYRAQQHDPESAVLAITQSGETADTLASIREAKRHGLLTLGIVNVVGSSIARETDAGVYNHAGPEVGVASTKAFISQLTVAALIALRIGRARGLDERTAREVAAALASLPERIAEVLAQKDTILDIARRYAHFRDYLYIGRTHMVPVAYEGALKLKEVSYVHAEGYAAGEMKHGPIAMIDENFPTVAIVTKNEVYEKMISNIEEIKARKGPVLALATEGDTQISSLVDDVIYLPAVHPVIEPIIATVPLHLFAYGVGTAKGFNVDRPRNLAKSVTVE